jgi:hypothetical protein
MYKYLGLGLMSLVAILMIPAQDAESFTETSMYGMAILTVHDSTGNALLTNTVHNIVVNQGTKAMLGAVFNDNQGVAGIADNVSADAICLTDATGFAPVDTMTSVTFLTDGGGDLNALDDDGGTDDSCKVMTFTLTDIAITGAMVNFAAGGDNVANGAVITGFAVCTIDADLDGCTAANPIIGSIATSVTLGAGETVDITYVLNLD